MIGVFSIAIGIILILIPGESSAAAQGTCRRLLGDERAACVGRLHVPAAKRKRELDRRATAPDGGASSSSTAETPVSFPDVFQMSVETDPLSVPEGMSCIRFQDIKRVRCQERVRQNIIRDAGPPDARGVTRATAPRSSSSSPSPISNRRHCLRLPWGEQRECAIEYRQGVAAWSKQLR